MPKPPVQLAVILPCYNEGTGLVRSAKKISEELDSLNVDYRLHFIDDGSKDDTWQVIETLAKKNERYVGLRLSRNFGKEYAILAGLQEIDAEYYLVTDADLQHPPSTIKILWNAVNEDDIDAAEGIKADRGNESLLYKLCSNVFYKTLHIISNLNLKNSSDFKLFTKRFRNAVLSCEDHSFFFRGACNWVGFNRKNIPFRVEDRAFGKSKFSLRVLLNMVNNAILSNTKALLKISTFIGLIVGIFSILLAIQTLYTKLTGQALNGFTTVILVVAFQSTFLFLSLGILGEYLSRIYQEVKNKPSYILRTKTKF